MDFLNIKDIDYGFVFDVTVHYNRFYLKNVEHNEIVAVSQ